VIDTIERAQAVLFGGAGPESDPEVYRALAGAVPTTELTLGELESGVDLLGLIAATGLGKSKGEVRRNIAGYRINGEAVGDRVTVTAADLRAGGYLLLQRGRSHHHLVVVVA